MSDRSGQKLGNYLLSRLIGRGGFADVYHGEHVYLRTPAAIKLLHVQLTPEALETFLAEARTVARLVHPHIVRVLEFGIEQEMPFLVMSYAPHGSLRQRYPRGSTLPEAQIVSYVRQVAEALYYAHERKVIHSDVKPENMLLDEDDALMLTDFGIAATSSTSDPEEEPPAVLNGTISYMAPELFDDHPCPASDQYALAVVAYEWCCGRPPFKGPRALDVVLQHVQTPPPPLLPHMARPNAAFEAVVMRALAKAPEERYPSIVEFAQELEEACRATPHKIVAVKQHSPAQEQANSPLKPDTLIPFTAAPAAVPAAIVSVKVQHSLRRQRGMTRRGVLLGLAGLGGVLGLGVGIGGMLHGANLPAGTAVARRPTLKSTSTQHPAASATVQATPSPTPGPQPTATTSIVQQTSPGLLMRPEVLSTSSRPAITAWPGRYDLFVRGSDNALWHAWHDGSWHGWESLGGMLSYDPAAISWGAGRFDLFARGSDNTLQYKYYDGVWHDWQSLGGYLGSDPAVSSWGPGRLDVFVCSWFTDLYHKRYDGAWHDFESLGGLSTTFPAAAAPASGQLYLFIHGYDNALWYRHYDGKWQDWVSQGKVVANQPAATSPLSGQLAIFMRGSDNALKYRTYSSSTWHDWQSAAGYLATPPSAASAGNGRIELIARGSDNTLQHGWYDGAWHGWEVLR